MTQISNLFPKTARLKAEPISQKHRDFFTKLFSSKLVHQRMGSVVNYAAWISSSSSSLNSWISNLFDRTINESNHCCFVWTYRIFPIGIGGYHNKDSDTTELYCILIPEFWNQEFELEIIKELAKQSHKKYIYISVSSKKDLEIAERAGFNLTEDKHKDNPQSILLRYK